ncbi:MAG: hypothetical protein L0332_04535 [Chloroflexi bacterium]|nr:hypothetical protein [Chloroflexota bacterium]MCI0580135.1 hypothetical protein [Chloroflexota bacterium]MCI0649289.1 hypothetical protein [Chloroflexota bacterium]MCI0725978.1 hypothetical protein [Chloroflexota bacterium]
MRSRRFQSRPELEEPRPAREPRLAAASLLLLGLLLGLAGALYYAWVVDPVSYTAASPARLSDQFKAEYILLVSQSYAADGNWALAQRRLAALNDPAIAQTVAVQLDRYLRTGQSAVVVRNLAVLAERLGASGPAVDLFAPTPEPGTATPTPEAGNATATPTLFPTPTTTRRPTSTPFPTLTPTSRPSPTVPPVYRLLSQERVCDPGAPAPRIEVEVVDALLEPLPGVEVLVQWEGGSDHFFTGFRPEQGPGYGDFTMSPDISYSVVIAEGSPTISGLRVENCDEEEGGLAGGWRLTFQNTVVFQETPTPEASTFMLSIAHPGVYFRYVLIFR